MEFQLWRQTQQLMRQFGGAIAFYTSLPMPPTWALEFTRVARWAPAVGLLIGGSLGLSDALLESLGMPNLTRSALVVGLWVVLTGGLHLDGAMDTADGLAVQDPERRLAVMADSRAGAFGVMSAIALLVIKTAALSDLGLPRTVALMAAAGWGRWGQLWAIAAYPNLKPDGKGAIHKATIQVPWDLVPGLGLLLSCCGLAGVLQGSWVLAGALAGGGAIAGATAAWFNHKLGGHTGDTYGAVVEWTETFILCALTLIDVALELKFTQF